MPGAWLLVDEAVGMVLGGDVHNPAAVLGILACHAAQRVGDRGA